MWAVPFGPALTPADRERLMPSVSRGRTFLCDLRLPIPKHGLLLPTKNTQSRLRSNKRLSSHGLRRQEHSLLASAATLVPAQRGFFGALRPRASPSGASVSCHTRMVSGDPPTRTIAKTQGHITSGGPPIRRVLEDEPGEVTGSLMFRKCLNAGVFRPPCRLLTAVTLHVPADHDRNIHTNHAQSGVTLCVVHGTDSAHTAE